MHDERAPLHLARREILGRALVGVGLVRRGLLGAAAQPSAPSLSPSNSTIGPVGITVEIACL
jgi:hypothetical protein